MALVKKTQPVFEQEPGDTTVAERPAEAQQTAPAQADPVAATTTALAKASTSSLTVQAAADEAKRFKREVEEMKGNSNFDYGIKDTFKADGGSIAQMGQGKDLKLGTWVKVRLTAWDYSYQVSPGGEGASTKDFVAYSKGGKTIDSVIGSEQQAWVGSTVQDYVDHLIKVEEFPGAKVRTFIDTACYLLATENNKGPIGKTVQIVLSKTSMTSFSRYQAELEDNAMAVQMGLPGAKLPEDPHTFYFVVERVSDGKGKKWDKLKISATMPDA